MSDVRHDLFGRVFRNGQVLIDAAEAHGPRVQDLAQPGKGLVVNVEDPLANQVDDLQHADEDRVGAAERQRQVARQEAADAGAEGD